MIVQVLMTLFNELIRIVFFLNKKAFLHKIESRELEVYEFLLSEKTNDYSILRMIFQDIWHKGTIQRKANNQINWIAQTLTDEIKQSIHSKYKQTITSKVGIPQEFNALAFMRESVNKGYELKQSLAQSSNENMALQLGFKPYPIKLTVSGYKSPLLAILEKNTHIRSVFVESVDRLSRHLGLTIDLLDYCSLNNIKIYVGSNIMNRGVGRATLLLLAVFAEYELTSKQTSYSDELLNVIKLELRIITPDIMTDSELKLFNNLQFVEQEGVFKKAIALAGKYINDYDSKIMIKTKKGERRKANNDLLYANAKEIIKLLTE